MSSIRASDQNEETPMNDATSPDSSENDSTRAEGDDDSGNTDPASDMRTPDTTDGYAIEMRAETISLVYSGDAMRHGEIDRVEGGDGQSNDTVVGNETAKIAGTLREHAKDLTLQAARLETTVEGRLSISCKGEDTILLGGVMADTWTGGAFIGAAMSDDMIIGAGVRVTSPADLWLNALTGMEERPGTAVADGAFIELCGTLF